MFCSVCVFIRMETILYESEALLNTFGKVHCYSLAIITLTLTSKLRPPVPLTYNHAYVCVFVYVPMYV